MTSLEKEVKRWPAEKRAQYEEARINYQTLNEIRISLNNQIDGKLAEIRKRFFGNHGESLDKLAEEYHLLQREKIYLRPRYREAWKKLIDYYRH